MFKPEVLQNDEFSKELVKTFEEGDRPDKRQAVIMLRFFAQMVVVCRYLGLFDLAELWEYRLGVYNILLQKAGYKYGMYKRHRRKPGLADMYDQAFAVGIVRDYSYTYRRGR